MTSPTADVSVRVAWPADAPAVAAVQVAGWRLGYAGTLPDDVLAGLEVDAFAARWADALERPVDARNRVLVALERAAVRGFAVTGPCPDPDADPRVDGELVELVVHPDVRGRGHGSRLLQAGVDTLRSDGFERGVTWLGTTDDAARAFLSAAGWAADGASRELDLHGDGTVRLKQVRLHTDLRTDS